MTPFKYFVGIDIASATFTACTGTTPWAIVVKPETFDNDEEGFTSFLAVCRRDKYLPSPTEKV